MVFRRSLFMRTLVCFQWFRNISRSCKPLTYIKVPTKCCSHLIQQVDNAASADPPKKYVNSKFLIVHCTTNFFLINLLDFSSNVDPEFDKR